MLGAVRPACRAMSVNLASNGRPERLARCCGWMLRVAMPCAKSETCRAVLCRRALRVMPGRIIDRPGSRALRELRARLAQANSPIANPVSPIEVKQRWPRRGVQGGCREDRSAAAHAVLR